MAYTTINKSTDYFNTKLYTGNDGTGRSITGVGFQPDLVWVKDRSNAYDHGLFDAVRGVTKDLRSNTNIAESTNANSLTAFGADGFTVGSHAIINGNNNNYASWNWKANGAGSANTDGSINTTSTSVNTTAGFSISKWTATGSGGTIGHGLGAVPNVMIVKRIDGASDWIVYHSGNTANPETDFLRLNTNVATQDNNTIWNDTAPTSSVFSVGTEFGNGYNYLTYCFAEKTGYSKFGSYTGNGNADGTFVYTGFKPQLVIIKQTSGATNWAMNDIKRQQYNAQDIILYADTNGAESGYGGNYFDILSNGFKMRLTSSYYNGSGNNYIYMAFGQSIVGTNNIPATAR